MHQPNARTIPAETIVMRRHNAAIAAVLAADAAYMEAYRNAMARCVDPGTDAEVLRLGAVCAAANDVESTIAAELLAL